MTLYARSDLMSVSIPTDIGGCGKTHTRPVSRGVPAKVWKLDCAQGCESYLRGDGKPKVIKVIPGDKDRGVPSRMEHVVDAHPQWSTTPEGIPPTPDEEHVHRIRTEKGAQELQMLQALVAMRGSGMSIPDNAMWLLEQNFDPRLIHGKVICNNGHDNVPGSRFCHDCGIKMAAQGAIQNVQVGDPDGQEVDVSVVGDTGNPYHPAAVRVDALPLRTLHVATLKKMAREKGLSDKGTKAELIERLS